MASNNIPEIKIWDRTVHRTLPKMTVEKRPLNLYLSVDRASIPAVILLKNVNIFKFVKKHSLQAEFSSISFVSFTRGR